MAAPGGIPYSRVSIVVGAPSDDRLFSGMTSHNLPIPAQTPAGAELERVAHSSAYFLQRDFRCW